MRQYVAVLEALAAAATTNGDDIGAYVAAQARDMPSYCAVFLFSRDPAGLRAAGKAVASRSSSPYGYLYGSLDDTPIGFGVALVDAPETAP
jgi:hypothetical protein